MSRHDATGEDGVVILRARGRRRTADRNRAIVYFDAVSRKLRVSSADGDRALESTGGPPSGAAGGALTGTYPNPGLAAHATSHKHGGSDEVATASPSANWIPKADSSGKLDAWISSATNTVYGLVKLAATGGAQAYSAILVALAGLTGGADLLPYFTGASAMATATLTASARTLLALTVARGSIAIASASATWSSLTISADGKYLRSNGTDPSWSTLLSADLDRAWGLRWLLPDPAPSGSSYQRAGDGDYWELTADTTFGGNVANAITSPPSDFAFSGTNAFSSASISSAELVLTSPNATYDWTASTHTGPFVSHGAYYLGDGDLLYFRLRSQGTTTGQYFYAMCQDTADNTKFIICGIRSGGAGLATIFTSCTADTKGSADALTDGQAKTTGVWFRVEIRGGDARIWYSLTNSATIPTSGWVFSVAKAATFAGPGKLYKFGFGASAAGTGCVSQAMAIDDRRALGIYGTTNPVSGARGYDTTGPVLTVIASADVGAAAVIADADLQAVLAAAANRRAYDAGTWTFSAVRGASASPAASTYQAAASVAVSGTGRYFALYAKCTSSSVQAGSLHLPTLRIPVVS